MESSSTLLKTRSKPNHLPTHHPSNVLTTAIATVLRPSPLDPDYGDGDGPYFDLEFSIPEEEDEEEEEDNSSSDSNDPSVSFSPSNDLFFTATPNSKPLFSSSLLKSATKIRVFLLRFKKPKPHPDSPSPKKQKQHNNNSKTYLVKLKVKELLLQDHASSRSSNSSSSRSTIRSNVVEDAMTSPAEEKRNPKDVIHRYLNKIKPLSFHKPRFSGNLTASKRLRKSRSASSAVAAVRSPPSCQRDDSLVQQEDGIQSAIAHCKRSFSAGKGSDAVLARSRSDPGF